MVPLSSLQFANGGDLLRYVRTQRRLQEPSVKERRLWV